jgi:hypothetical protein
LDGSFWFSIFCHLFHFFSWHILDGSYCWNTDKPFTPLEDLMEFWEFYHNLWTCKCSGVNQISIKSILKVIYMVPQTSHPLKIIKDGFKIVGFGLYNCC